jgi:hypothetical protein
MPAAALVMECAPGFLLDSIRRNFYRYTNIIE